MGEGVVIVIMKVVGNGIIIGVVVGDIIIVDDIDWDYYN